MTDATGGLIPARWVMPLWPQHYEQVVIVNWLQVELPRPTEMKALDELKGWRNREVFEYVKSYDWTARIYEK
jgi:hypothetical protein